MSVTLYNKYRPVTFDEIVGQDHVKRILQQELLEKHIAHAYLFSGPRGTGKTSVARIFARTLGCDAQDIIEIDAASNRRIDEIRQLREQVRYVPARGEYKVYIIDEVHMLTTEAFNALLKTLEEPPKHAVFILATTELVKIPETIFSRCQHFAFTKISFGQIMERLKHIAECEGIVVEDDVLNAIARKSTGALRDAESLLGQLCSIGKKHITADDVRLFLPKIDFEQLIGWIGALLKKDTKESLERIHGLLEHGVNIEIFLEHALSFARLMMVYKATGEAKYLSAYYSSEEIETVSALSGRYSLGDIRAVVVELLRASQDMNTIPDVPLLPIELAVVAICMQRSGTAPHPMGTSVSLAQKKTNGAFTSDRQKPVPENPSNREKKRKTEDAPPMRAVSSATQIAHSLEDILEGWGEVLTRVKDKNHALNFAMGVSAPVAVKGDTVELGFKYQLHQEKIKELNNRNMVETILEEVYGTKYRIETFVKEDVELFNTAKPREITPEEKAPNLEEVAEEELIKTALEVFEGAVVEN